MAAPLRVFMSGPPARIDAFRAIEETDCEVSYGLSVDEYPNQAYTEDELIGLLQKTDIYVPMTREGYNRRIADACPNLLMIEGGWKRDELLGDLLYEKTVGIVGLGRVGGHVAQRLGPWGMRLLAYDPLHHHRVILTPHSVGNSYASRMGGQRMAVESIKRALRGEVPEHVINSEVVDRWQTRLAERR